MCIKSLKIFILLNIMRFLYLFIVFVNCENFIKNVNINSCRNCIHYKAAYHNDYNSDLNRCAIFGENDIITDEISYNFVKYCRENENECGKKGKYFEEDKFVKYKIIKHALISNTTLQLYILTLITNSYLVYLIYNKNYK